MAENGSQVVKTVKIGRSANDLRILPFVIAGLFCFTIAIALGSGSWFLANAFRQNAKLDIDNGLTVSNTNTNQQNVIIEQPSPVPVTSPSESPTPSPTPATDSSELLKNTVMVTGGEVVIGGGETKRPLERILVKDFSIFETEVTNSQYAEFLKETNHEEPMGWNKTKFPKGTENFPVTNVSWFDAKDFCDWMSKKTGETVRLPSEAEWELAARGREGLKYPWGNEWKKGAMVTKETGGKVTEVKKHEINKSPFGAFDMVGNVWEWTSNRVDRSEETSNEAASDALKSGKILRIVKGGSASEKSSEISGQLRFEIPEKTKVPLVGFRFIVEKK